MIEAYFYTCCNRHGKIKKMKGWIQYDGATDPEEKAMFLTPTKRRYVCAAVPGVVFKDSVWLLRENDEVATKAIKEHRMREIRKLEELLEFRYDVYNHISMEEGVIS